MPTPTFTSVLRVYGARSVDALADIREVISDWTHGEDWQTWIAHTVIAVGLTPLVGKKVAVGYYFLRECEQIIYAYVDKKKISWFDNFMDIAVPAVVVYGLFRRKT